MRPDRRFPASKVQAVRRYLRWIRSESARSEQLERLRARFPEALIEDGVHIVSPERLELEPEAVIQFGCHLHCGGRDWTDGGGFIRIGRKTVVGPHCVLWGGGGITIGGGVFLGPGAMIFSTGERFEVKPGEPDVTHTLKPVVLGDEARVGAQAMILPGAGLEPACVLGANSVLSTTVPTGKIYAGVPAAELRDLRTFRHTLD